VPDGAQGAVFLNQGAGSCPDPSQPRACPGCRSSWLAEVFQFKDERTPWALWTPARTMYNKVALHRPDANRD
jgi:hypothetical protein